MSTEVTRRSALTASVVVVVGGIAGFAFGRHSKASKHPAVSGYAHPAGTGISGGGGSEGGELITELTKVPIGGGLIKGGLVVTRPSANVVHAFSSQCTHLGCTVNSVTGGKIFCPCHGSVFNADTGAVVQGPAGSPLPAVPVTIKDGGVYTA